MALCVIILMWCIFAGAALWNWVIAGISQGVAPRDPPYGEPAAF